MKCSGITVAVVAVSLACMDFVFRMYVTNPYRLADEWNVRAKTSACIQLMERGAIYEYMPVDELKKLFGPDIHERPVGNEETNRIDLVVCFAEYEVWPSLFSWEVVPARRHWVFHATCDRQGTVRAYYLTNYEHGK